MYIDDCITGIQKLMDSNYSDPLNLGRSELVSINQLADMIQEIAGVKVKRRHNLNAPQGVRGRNSDNTLIKVCSLGTIPGNGQATVEVVTQASGSGRVTNTASVVSAGIDGNPSDNVASAAVDIGGTDTNKPNNDDENDKPKETEEERRQREHTNRGGLDDDRTEGNVVAVRCADGAVADSVGWMDDGMDAPYAVIVNRDGLQKVRLIGEARTTCRSIKVGQYLEADGVKQTEQLFDAENVTLRK